MAFTFVPTFMLVGALSGFAWVLYSMREFHIHESIWHRVLFFMVVVPGMGALVGALFGKVVDYTVDASVVEVSDAD